MVAQHQETLGLRASAHSYNAEVRRNSDGRWVVLLVHADSRMKAVKMISDAGYNAAGGDMQQVR